MKRTVSQRLLMQFAWIALLAGSFVPSPARAQILYTNFGSLVSIVAPANHAVFYFPVDIPMFAYARDGFGVPSAVNFYAGTNRLGAGHLLSVTRPWQPYPPIIMPLYRYGQDQYTFVWTNPPIGTYALTAVASSMIGKPATSAPVVISILASTPPATNKTDVVSIIATDPVAIEGTNCWYWRGPTNATPGWPPRPPIGWAWFTNCGPKNAVFAVRRFGDCSQSLTVKYTTSGTATNGVNYVLLPGAVTIPAGSAYTLIPLVPINDGKPDFNRSAILTLAASTDQPATYLLGSPRSAAALIIDSNLPRPVTGMLPGQVFHVNAAGPDGAWFHVEYSTDMLTWQPICTNQVVNGALDFVDPDAQNNQARFYRAIPETETPSQ
jgi:hypothetical protein